MRTRGKDIVTAALGGIRYRYWYGAKGQVASKDLADNLRASNPSVWTYAYYQAALKDIDGTQRVCDCSGLVCEAYDIPQIGSWQIVDKFPEWTSKEKVPGMIVWRPGHVGVIIDSFGHVAEMRSLDRDFGSTRTIETGSFTKVLYSPDVDYWWDREVGWHCDSNGWWYASGTRKGEYYHECWKVINHRWFYFDHEGYIKTGAFSVDGKTYFATTDGLYHGVPNSELGDIELWEVE